jgi:hypothetical protein
MLPGIDGALTKALTDWLYRSRTNTVHRDDSTLWVRLTYSKAYRLTSAVIFAAIAAMFIGLVTTLPPGNGLWFAGALAGVFLCGATAALLDALFFPVYVGPEGLRRDFPANQGVLIRWPELTAVRYSTGNSYFVFCSTSSTIRITAYRDGLANLCQELYAHAPEHQKGNSWFVRSKAHLTGGNLPCP